MLVSAAIAAVLILANLAMPHRLRLIGVAILLVPQLYLPGLPISIAVLWTVLTCVAGLATRGRSRPTSPLLVILDLLIAITALSLLWALPSGTHLGIVTVCIGVLFLLWLREVMMLARDDPGLLDTMMKWAVPGIAVQAVLVIVFRVSPMLEQRFLASWVGTLTVGPAAEHIFTDSPANVLAESKAGGFFVNGNVASLFGCVAAVLLCVVARRTMRRWPYAFAALSVAGAVCTGSKSAFIIGSGLTLVIIYLPYLRRIPAVLVAVAAVIVVPLALEPATGLIERIAPTFYAAADLSYGTRAQLWSRAVQMFLESPILGTGFGGWAERVGRVGSRTDLPPHNVIVAAWAYSGILAAVLAVVFMVVAIAFGLRVVASQRTIYDRRTAAFALCGITWAFLHGMGDNTALYGDRQSMILIAIAYGYLFAMRWETGHGEIADATAGLAEARTTPPHRRTARRPALEGRRGGPGPLRRAGTHRVVRTATSGMRRRPTRRLPERLDVRGPRLGRWRISPSQRRQRSVPRRGRGVREGADRA
jgi:O-antigen ligase